MRRISRFFIVSVLIVSILVSTIAFVGGQGIEHHPSWDKDIPDMLDYIRQCYNSQTQTFTWLYPKDAECYQLFFDNAKEVQVIREQNKDESIVNLVDVPLALEYLDKGLEVLKMEYGHSTDMFSELKTLSIIETTDEVTTIASSLGQHVETTRILIGQHEFTSVTEIRSFVETKDFAYTVEGVDWSKVEIVKYKGVSALQIIISLWKVADAVYKHNFVISNKIAEALIEPDNIVQKIKDYELKAETGMLVIDLAEIIGETVGTVIGQSVGLAIGGSIGASFTGVFPPAPLVGATVGYFAGGWLTGEAFEAAAGILASKAVQPPLLKYIDELGIEYEKISVKITSIYSEGSDYIVSTREKIYVTIENTGMYEREFIVSTNPSFWEITDYWGWFEWERVDWDNVKKVDLKPLESETIWFAATPDEIHTEETLTFNVWYETGFLWWTTHHMLDSKTEVFHSIPFVVETSITARASDWFVSRGETAEMIIDVLNVKTTSISFVLDTKLRDPTGQFEKYNSQLGISPSDQATLEPNQKTTFIVTWTVPLDAPVGYYQLEVDCRTPQDTQTYLGNLPWKYIFLVYDLDILSPTAFSPAKAGNPNAPNSIFVYVTGLPMEETPYFFIRIDGAIAPSYEIVDRLPVPIGYTLKVSPPAQASEGKYDLDVAAFFGRRGDVYTKHSSDQEPNAVEYTSAPSVEPIEKGLAWLRTRQYGDGSWLSNVGVTSLAALAFLNAGYDETGTTVSKAISYILSKVHSDGSIYTSYSVYETSTAILPLVATHNENYATIIENAKNWLVGAQQDEDFGYTPTNYQYGGWTYWSVKGDPDLSNTQFALLALDAANLPKTDPTWSKAIIFTQRCQNRPASNDQTWAHDTTQPSYNDGGFIYRPWGWSLAGGTVSYGSMTGAGIWGLLLSGVTKTDARVVAAMNWVKNHFTWDTNPGIGWWRPYYYYLSMSKALTMYGQSLIDGYDWYQELYDKIVGMQIDAGFGQGYWSTYNEDYVPDLTTAYAILSLQTRAVAPPVQRLSYLTFILRSNCLIRILDSEANLVGYNYITGLGENQIPTAVYSGPFFEPQYIVVINPQAGTYKLELIGVSEGPYELIIQGNYGEEVTDTFEYTGEIKPAELHGSQVIVTAIVGPIDIYANPPEFEEIIDNTPPSITVLTPSEEPPPEAVQDGVTLEALVTDPSGVDWVTFSIRESDGSIIDPMFESMSATNVGNDLWQLWFNTYVPELPDGYYLLLVNASDMLGNEGSKTVVFSIRNWACLELLPATQSNKAGRTMPVKFSLRIFESVDPAKPFVWNEELTIKIYATDNPTNILQTSTYGTTARDYRIDTIGELYITNFKTLKTPKTYVVEIWRKGMLIGSFEFKTAK